MWRQVLILLLCCLGLVSCDRIGSSGDPFIDFRETVLTANTNRNKELAGHVFHPYDITGQVWDQLDKLKAALDSRTYYEAVNGVRNIVSEFSEYPSVQETASGLLDEIKRQEQIDLTALAGQFQSAQKIESATLLTAEKPEDLDAALQTLAALDKQIARCWTYDGGRVEAYRDFLQTKRYVTKWQDYLLARNNADAREAFHAALYLKDINPLGLPLPRSQLIERLATLEREKPLPYPYPAPFPAANSAPTPAAPGK
jgi:hypothetical protein